MGPRSITVVIHRSFKERRAISKLGIPSIDHDSLFQHSQHLFNSSSGSFVKWTPYVDECCELLEKYGDQPFQRASNFSKLNYQLGAFIILSTHPENCDKPKITKYVLSELQTNLATIKAKLKPEHHQYRAYYYSVEAYLYQPNFANFNLVSTDKKSCTQNLSTDTLVDVAQCTTSCLYALDEFSMLLSGEVSALPLFYSSRVIYTAGMLLRLRYLILSLPSHIEKN